MRALAALVSLTVALALGVTSGAQAGTYRPCTTGGTDGSSPTYDLKRYGMTCKQAQGLLKAWNTRFLASGGSQTLPRSVNGYSCTYRRSAGIDFSGRCFSKRRNEGIRFRGALVDA